MGRLIRTILSYHIMEKDDKEPTKKIIFDMNEDLDQRFRETVVKEHGLHRGVIRKSLEEAVSLWLDIIENKDKGEKALLNVIKKRLESDNAKRN